MAFASGNISISLEEDILSKVSEIDIISYYLNLDKIPCVINSPLRVDNNPSFGIYTRDNKRVFYSDLAKGDRGGIYDLLSQLWGTDFYSTIERIYEDIEKIPNNRIEVSSLNKSNKITHSNTTLLQCKVRDWKSFDLEYWESYGISLPFLKFGDIYPISHTIITKEDRRYVFPADKYAYAYVERKDGEVSLKIYQPFNSKYKWTNKHDSSVWDLWTKLPEKGENLIITSSRKDALCVWENTGIPTVSLQAESYLPKEHVMNELKNRFHNIYVLYDNDYDSPENYGRKFGEAMSTQFNISQIEIPSQYQSKDPSDLAFKHGRKVVREVILSLIENIKKVKK